MLSPLEYESIGDWNNLKGTVYHLVYALWLLIYKKVPSVAFYQGNDLITGPPSPPRLQDPQSIVALYTQQAYEQEEDIWIQLKSTEKPWSLTELSKDNLLANFLYNALSSERQGRKWRTQLITQAPIGKEDIQTFLTQPGSKPKFSKDLKEIITKVQQRWLHAFQHSVDETDLHILASIILQQLAETKPVYLETLKAQIETEIAYQGADRESVRGIAQRLLGALLTDTGRGPEEASAYTAAWVEHVAGLPIISGTLLTNDPVSGCVEAVKTALPQGWNIEHCITRPFISAAFRQFLLLAQEPLFVLVGANDVGKSWAVADWAIRGLDGYNRLLIRGSELYSYRDDGIRELSTLVAGKLRPYAPADWSDETFLRHVLAAPKGSGRGSHLVIIIDDLRFPSDPQKVDLFLDYLGRLVEYCHVHRVKLVLTCQKHVWDSYRLSKVIQRHHLFVLDPDVRVTHEPAQTQVHNPYSFHLTDLTHEEVRDVLAHRLTRNVEQLAFQLRAPAFDALRNPYVLNLYLDRYTTYLGEPNNIPSVEIDALLDGRVHDALDGVVERVGCSKDQISGAFDALLQRLWEVRPGGLRPLEAVEIMKTFVVEQVNTALQRLRQVGLFTIDSPIRFAEPTVADYLFAKHLERNGHKGEEMLGELHPETDIGVVIVLLKRSADPISFAERLLACDPSWLPAVTAGLARRSPDEYSVLSLLSVLARPEPMTIKLDACDALGQLASRGGRAWEWIERMYLSDRVMERMCGERALAIAIEYAPDHVEKVIQQRLERAAEIDDSKHEKRERLLQGALSPLFMLKHTRAAEVGRRILHGYGYLMKQGKSRRSLDILKDLEEVRGRIALLIGEEEIDSLLAELHMEDPQARWRAACALRPIIFERPERVQNAFCEAIKREKDSHVLNHLLWVAYRLGEVASDALLDAIEANFAVCQHESPLTAGITLSLLANLADRCPYHVYQLLPQCTTPSAPWASALLSEMQAFAWWRCAEHIPDAHAYLISMLEPLVTDVPPECHLFALRGAAIALLGVICLDMQVPSLALVGRQTAYPLGVLQFFYLNSTDFLQHHAPSLKAHPQFVQLREALIGCVQEEANVSVHPGSELRDARYLCALSCQAMLRSLENSKQTILSASQESVCYATLKLVGRATEFTTLLSASPDTILSVLDSYIRDDVDLSILYYWKEETSSWSSLLIGRVYARMFDITPIDAEEAQELCIQMLTGLRALPDSPERRQYEAVYESIARWLQGAISPLPTFPPPSSLLQRTHAYALSILERAHKEKDSTWLLEALHGRHGWLDTTRYRLEDTSISLGTHAYMAYVFPAVRLAGIAVGQLFQCDDPAAQLIRARLQVNKVLKEHWQALNGSIPTTDHRLQKALTVFEEHLKTTQDDERLWQYRGLVLLRLNRLVEAEEALQHCLSLSWCGHETRADAYYNLGCVYARMGKEDECRQMLQIWSQLQLRNQPAYDWLMRDSDLETMREKPWFQELYGTQEEVHTK